MSNGITPIDAAVQAVREAIREGAVEAEAYVAWSRGLRVIARAGRLESLESIDDVGIGVRAAVGRRIGFAYSTSLNRAKVLEVARQAVKIAKASPEDKYWPGLPSPSPSYPEPEAIYEPSLAEAEPSVVVEKVVEALRTASEAAANLVSATSSVLRIERAIANSQGVYRIDVGTYAYTAVGISIKTRTGSVSPAVFHVESSRTTIPSGELVAKIAVEKAKLCENTVKLDGPRRAPVVYTPQAFAQIFYYTLAQALRGDQVAQHRSPYTGKLGEKVASDKLTIIDDGVMRGGDNTWRFDGEGVAMKRKLLIEKGVLKNYVLDNYWARRLGMESTGNAVRAGYSSQPLPGYTNIVIEAGVDTIDTILEGEVIVVYDVQGAHSSNPETGEYSVLANPAILYKDGEPKGWIPGLMVSSNIYEDVLNRIEAVSRAIEHALPGFYAPWIRFGQLMVAPKKT